jgi:hypothetical protein
MIADKSMTPCSHKQRIPLSGKTQFPRRPSRLAAVHWLRHDCPDKNAATEIKVARKTPRP